jgi:uncharacterized protein (DUF1778 family)
MTTKTSQKTSARLEARISQETKALVQKAADIEFLFKVWFSTV